MNQWFYAEGNRERRGPVTDAELASLLDSARISLDTLVWRQGMSQWLPLTQFAAELGLSRAFTTAALPPELPSQPPPSPAAARPPAGLSGCAIMAIAGVALGLLLIAVLGILAAIAIPAYQDYSIRSKVDAAQDELAPLKAQINAFIEEQQRCPVNDDSGFGTAESYAGEDISSVRIGRFDNGHCGLEALFGNAGNAALQDKAIWLERDPDNGQWRCSSDLDDKHLPVPCRG